jgi:rhodanese-related sulfurtransferase
MKIKKFIRTNWIFLAALLLILVIIVVLLGLRAPSVAYRINPEQVAAIVADSGNQVSPVRLYEELTNKKSNPIVVDIRSSDDFAKGHIEKAVNIPVRELLQPRSLSFFKELKKTNAFAILYGEDQLQAGGPWLLLKQVGFDNIKVLQGGYSFYKTLPLPDSLMKVRMAELNIEMPQIDTMQFRKPGVGATTLTKSADKKSPEKVIPVKKQGSSGGGC